MQRIDVLRKELQDDEAVFLTSYPNIFYYSGFTSEDCDIIITKSRQILFTDSRYTIQAHLQSPDFEVFDIFADFDTTIKALNIKTLLIEEDVITVKKFSALSKYDFTIKPFSKQIIKPRYTKDNKEIENIKKAQEITDKAFLHILDFVKEGRTEREIVIELEYYMRKQGATKPSFDTVCASGSNSAMPHAVATDKPIKNGDFVTLDFGCVVGGYCSDMTRTFAVGFATDKMQEIYSVVLEAQKNALDNIKCSMECKNADKLARDIIVNYGYGDYFGHATGHSVGIEIHENPNLSPKSDDVLSCGNVVTVEPGIYIENQFGVRIEDLLLINTENCINLTKSQKDLLII